MKNVISLSRYLVISPKLKDCLSCILSAILLIFSFPRTNLWIFAWFGFVPLFFALKNKSQGKAFLLSYLTGIIFWSGIIYWLIHVTLPGTIVLILYLALYFGLFGIIFSKAHLLPTTHYLLFTPALWVLLEYIRSHLFTGFGWALLGYSQYLNSPIIQIADTTGVWGVSFLLMMVNLVIYSIIDYRLSIIAKKIYLLAVLVFALTLLYGYYKLYQTPDTRHQILLKISVIQGNIPQELKWQTASRDFIVNRYLTLSAQATKDQPDLIIWPEAALPVVLEEEPRFFEKVRDFAKEIKVTLLLGVVTSRDKLYYNSAILVSPEARLLECYDKLHLVPFGEYIPFRKILSFLETIVPIGDIERGRQYTIFKIQNPKFKIQNKFAVLICFEDLFPELSREFVKKGADFLVNITNDAWYKKTSAAFQHLQASVFRAVENRLFLVRAANTGVSGFIAPTGKIISLVQDKQNRDIFIDGYDTEEIVIQQKKNLSFYTRYGDMFIFLSLILVIYSIFRLARLAH